MSSDWFTVLQSLTGLVSLPVWIAWTDYDGSLKSAIALVAAVTALVLYVGFLLVLSTQVD